jgi:hypothetical protein
MNSYVVDSKISRLSDSDFHTAVYLGHSNNFSPAMTQVPQKSTGTKKDEIQELQEKHKEEIDKLEMTITRLKEEISELHEEKELIEHTYSDSKEQLEDAKEELEGANKQLAVRLNEEFKKFYRNNINDECTVILWKWKNEKKIISNEEEVCRKQIKLYSALEPSIFAQINSFFDLYLWEYLYVSEDYLTNTCIYDYHRMSELSFPERANKIQDKLRNYPFSTNTTFNIYKRPPKVLSRRT